MSNQGAIPVVCRYVYDISIQDASDFVLFCTAFVLKLRECVALYTISSRLFQDHLNVASWQPTSMLKTLFFTPVHLPKSPHVSPPL